MPEFIMPFGDVESVRTFNSLDAFTQGYVEAMFFTDTGTGDDEELEDACFDDLSFEALVDIIEDCRDFQGEQAAQLLEAYAREGYSEERAGHDYWLTRNGHGAGFWDRSELDEGSLGDKLSDACRYQPVSLYKGDDGYLYIM